MPSLASQVSSVPNSGIRRIHEIALQLDDVIRLAVGEPDVAVAPHVLDAGSAAWLADDTDYTANGGIPELRAAIKTKLAERNGIDVDTEQVWVTIGATQALNLAMSLTLSPGDEVLLPDPGYTTFTMNARMLGAEPVPYPLHPAAGFVPSIDELEKLVTERTRLIIVNSPSNPLGAVYPAEILAQLLDFASRHDMWVISDEVYEAFSYGAPHTSMASLDTEDRVFSVFSVSKTYAMTGARVGYLVTPPGLAETMRTYQEAIISCVDTPAQRAAVAAITGDQGAVGAAAAHYRGNLDAATALLDEAGISYLPPTGAFYLWIDISHASDGDVAGWAESFLLRERVSVAPGSAFGRSGEGWIRVCVAASREDLLEGLRRLPRP
ncbi:pyridoxal phosphate-dependent aminotransferase [Amnibacterium flavum]|uniref:Aminotransferase n=1 Tax=Amnibacterium flavum TaxID=2173173 RepID=A0A2V1HP42_9MICO|nr:aminotransferase class I/II-fold pyridoxal phosphate-dependent enzyme [Amnibacterium flavum]PVZ94101.1 aspartate aminotransferase [Amnibacterium flavum]